MSDYRFGADDYGLSIYPKEAFDTSGGFDIEKVERVEIDWVEFVRKRTCKVESTIRHEYEGVYAGIEYEHKLSCGHSTYWSDCDYPDYCPWCGCEVVE